MAALVYMLCALTSFGCAVLLFRAYRKNPIQLLLWSTVCFVALTANNILLFVDLVMVPTLDLSMLRTLIMFGGLVTLAYGLIWETL